jgi:WhiB family transcriptional regulator, redox-sensing transcriptional regulator
MISAFESGACRDIHSSVVHPDADDQQAMDRARAVCARCDVRLECLAFALRINDLDGIWGGLTAAERARYPKADFASMTHRR